MNQDSFDLASVSPILGQTTVKSGQIQTPSKNTVNLEEMHRHLYQHLTKKVTIPRPELKTYFDQVKRMNPDELAISNRRLLMKIRGLLSFILKRRADFQFSIIKGEITIFEKSTSEEVKTGSHFPEPPKFCSQPTNESINLGSSFLTNNDFLTPPSEQKSHKMEVENSYDCSEDLFPDTIESLHSYSQENYQMLKQMTNKTGDRAFKVPPRPPCTNNTSEKPYVMDKSSGDLVFERAVSLQDFAQTSDQEENPAEKAYKMHEALDENYNLLFSETHSLSQILQGDGVAADVRMGEAQTSFFDNDNVFDDLSISNEQLKEEFDLAHEQMETWLSELAHDLIHMQVNDTTFNPTTGIKGTKATTKINESVASSSSIPINPYYSEENLKIIREVCSEFKNHLEEIIESDKNLEVLGDLLNSSNMS